MTTSRLYKKTLLAVAVSSLTFASQHAAAAGFQLNSQSATGLGRAFAGDAVIADNASVMARNAAAMTLFDSHQFSGGVNYIGTDIDVKDVSVFNGSGYTPIDSANNSSGSVVPNIYYIHRINDSFAVGAGIYSNFGTKNNFDDSFGSVNVSPIGQVHTGASVFGGNTEIESINYTLNVAYRINEQWSIGGGLDIVQGSGKLQRTLKVTDTSTPPFPTSSTSVLDIDASGVGFGFNLGTVFELNENNRFGLAYHKQPEVEATGDFSGVVGSNFDSLYLSLPDIAEFSGFHKINNTKFAVHYSVQWIGWSVFDKLEGNVPGLGRQTIGTYEWKDGWHYALGGTYYLNDSWTLRAGYMYDTAAQDQVTSISVPDSDRQWFSAGFGYNFKQHHTVDFGFTYLLGKDVDVVEGDGALKATTHANAILAGIQYSYSF
ncbi:outer membrane protein transport protein [Vibrio mediterranei]|uniref:Transporter n=1 Tax=Vibrio mediterranei TaxID=689 RepID=A0A3G4V761_9VIBR|nr:outer membrane protein transport protein [Vibrio mediterranei]AYV20580.1 transporter [Vibrio mediterranei]